MKVPPNVEVYDTLSSTYWYDDEGFLCAISKKKSVPASLEDTKKLLEDFRATLKQEKICMLMDVTHSSETTREVRDYVAIEFPKFVKAIAMVSDSPLGKMLANLFFSLKTQPYPTKMFNDEEKARIWLKQYL